MSRNQIFLKWPVKNKTVRVVSQHIVFIYLEQAKLTVR